MARLVWVGVGLVAGIAIGTAIMVSHGQDSGDDSTAPSPTTIATAEKAGVDAVALLGAAHSTGLEPEQYLIAVGELAPPGQPTAARSAPQAGAAVAGSAGAGGRPAPGSPTLAYIAAHSRYGGRASCVAQGESRGGLAMWNPTPWGRFGEHAQSYFGWLPSTYSTVGDGPLGNLDSEIRAFDRMLDRGRGGEFAGIAAGRC